MRGRVWQTATVTVRGLRGENVILQRMQPRRLFARVSGAIPFVVAATCALIACSDEAAPDAPRSPATGVTKATDARTIVPTRRRASPNDSRKPSDPQSLQQMVSEGFGAYTIGPGEAPADHVPVGAAATPPGKSRTRLLRMAHLSDFQLADDESPARLASTDAPIVTDGAFRPQEAYGCRILDAVVRTVNRIHAENALDLVLLGGDNIDNAQQNELDWLFALLDGSSQPLTCDSGDRDDLVAGPNNDPKDPFQPEGLHVPWYWVTGNHDVLMQGNLAVNDERITLSRGASNPGGTRDYRKAGGPVVRNEDVVPDARRSLMHRADIISRLAEAQGTAGPRGHGLGTYAVKAYKAFYTIDVPRSPIRFIVVDSSAETGAADGVIHRADVDAFVMPEIKRAEADRKWIIFASHHAVDTVTDGSGFGGTLQPDALTQKEWEDVLTSSPNAILDLVGHAHRHRVRFLARANTPTRGIWEMQTAAIADFPNQFRLLEVWDEDNGYITIRGSAVDYVTNDDAIVEDGRKLAIVDYAAGWSAGEGGTGTAGDRNVILWIKRP